MRLAERIIWISLRWPKTAIIAVLLLTLGSGAFIIRARLDMRPEDLLAQTEQLQAAQEQLQKEFGLHDLVVLGVVNEQHPDGVFNPETLNKVHLLTEFAAALADPNEPTRRVLGRNIIAPNTVDTIAQDGTGRVRFDWLMQKPPSSQEEARRIRAAALANPLLIGTVVSADGKALVLYLPISKKDFAYTVAERLRAKCQKLGAANGDEFHITGLPVAEGSFGKEMFLQMRLAAPGAALLLVLITWLLFRNLQLALAPVVLSACAVTVTMGLLTGTGHALNSLNSLLPIFIMPVAVLSSVHILSQFIDAWHRFHDTEETISQVMNELFVPLSFAALTSAAGSAAFAVFAPLLSLRDFAIFLGIGIALVWLLSLFFIPAYLMTIRESSLTRCTGNSLLNHPLRWLGTLAAAKPWLLIAVSLGLMLPGAGGILMMQLNGNPLTWFASSQAIRRADQVLSRHFGGTSTASLVLSGTGNELTAAGAAELLKHELELLTAAPSAPKTSALSGIGREAATAKSGIELLDTLAEAWNSELDKVPVEDKAGYTFWSAALAALDKVSSRKEIFTQPALLRYLADLQAYLVQQGDVVKSISISDVVKKMHQELAQGDPQQFTIPESVNLVADILTSFQNSHKRKALWHLVTPDYTKANLWLQLCSSDSRSMERLIKDTDQYLVSKPPPVPVAHAWDGSAYRSMTWQKTLLAALLKPLPVSTLVVCGLLMLLFRSPLWGLLAMLPLLFTVALLHGCLGWLGQDWDMPIAVSSLLLLGLATDFAIHFLWQAKRASTESSDWAEAFQELFDEPARAILRNVVLVAVGFTPLLLAPVMPYQMAGVFLAAIMLCSGFATLWLLPALLTAMKGEKVVAQKS